MITRRNSENDNDASTTARKQKWTLAVTTTKHYRQRVRREVLGQSQQETGGQGGPLTVVALTLKD